MLEAADTRGRRGQMGAAITNRRLEYLAMVLAPPRR